MSGHSSTGTFNQFSTQNPQKMLVSSYSCYSSEDLSSFNFISVLSIFEIVKSVRLWHLELNPAMLRRLFTSALRVIIMLVNMYILSQSLFFCYYRIYGTLSKAVLGLGCPLAL